jgi:outer membrane protein OmpA-like peptidoglycan-associated protein
MRFAIFFAVLMLALPAFAQESEMDRAESEIRDSMASAGVEVERAAPDELRLRLPSDITFDFNRAEVRHEFLPRIYDLARTLMRYPGMSVEVIGHADAIGPDDYNQALSERRARAVGGALMNSGVTYQRIGVRGMGEWEPIASNATEWGRARNRRVEIRIKTSK